MKDVNTRSKFSCTILLHVLTFPENLIHLLCRPVLTPQIAGIGGPPDTTNWSFWQTWSVDSGWLRTKLSKSNLKYNSNNVCQLNVITWFFRKGTYTNINMRLCFLPQLTNICGAFVNRKLAGSDVVIGGWVSRVLKIGTILTCTLATRFSN